jgi:hypothetical protein
MSYIYTSGERIESRHGLVIAAVGHGLAFLDSRLTRWLKRLP